MNIFLEFAYLFFIGSVIGWVIELFFRRFISSANPERKWINPGFCIGPYLPLYGVGLCILYSVSSLEQYHFFKNDWCNKIVLLFLMAFLMTVIEFIAGYVPLRHGNIRLWDYSSEWGNIDGIICPKFSLLWGLLGAVYYFLIHPYIKNSLEWLSRNLAFSFFIGVFFGIFIIDVANSMQIVSRLKKFALENNVIIRYEHIKAQIRNSYEKTAGKYKYRFFRPFAALKPLSEHLKDFRDSFEKIRPRNKK